MHSAVIIITIIVVPFSLCEKYIGAYYWSGGSKPLTAEDIDPTLITHLYYAFAEANPNGTLTLQNAKKGLAQNLLKLKETNPTLKLLVTCTSKNGSLSQIVANETLRGTFVQNARDLVKELKFDGLDLDWEFPTKKDKDNFSTLLKELREEFAKNDLLLTAAVRAIPITTNTGYNVTEMSRYLDVINVMTYDFYGSWSSTTGQNSPLYPHHLDTSYEKKYLNVDASVKNWIAAGAPKEKLAIGVPFYGRTFTLADPEKHEVHSPSKGGGKPSAVTYAQVLSSYQNYTTEWNEEQKCPFKYQNSTWLAYEDVQSVTFKAKYALQNELKGVFVWQLAGDDVTGNFSETKQPLLRALNQVLNA